MKGGWVGEEEEEEEKGRKDKGEGGEWQTQEKWSELRGWGGEDAEETQTVQV